MVETTFCILYNDKNSMSTEREYYMEKIIAVSLDVSRNSVLKVSELKKFIDVIKKMGYNGLFMYNEDLYEMPEYPLFGYMRGRYSKAELKELVAYGKEKGVTLYPVVEALGHIEHIFRWSEFNEVHDIGNTMLVDEPKTYELIETMIKTMREVYDTDILGMGCDESWLLGRGKHLDRFGYEEARSIFTRHMKKCVDIAHKYGFTPKLSSDMFFDFAGGKWGVLNDPDKVTPEIKAMLPENCIFGYWNYFPLESDVDKTMEAAKRFGAPVSYATSVDSWQGFTPHNHCAFKWMKSGVPSARRNDLDILIVTLWGDDGGECSVWSCLPAFFYAAQLFNGIEDMAEIEKNFKEIFDFDMMELAKLDYPTCYHGKLFNFNSPKQVIYNDPFCGIYDDLVFDDLTEFYARYDGYIKELSVHENHPEFGYLFKMAKALTELIKLRFDLGVRTRAAYKAGDKEALKKIVGDYTEVHRLADSFYDTFRTVWYKERKGNGFEVQSARLGGMKQRLLDCRDRLTDFIEGRIDRIEELEEDIIKRHGEEDYKTNAYGKCVSVNSLTHFNFYGLSQHI